MITPCIGNQSPSGHIKKTISSPTHLESRTLESTVGGKEGKFRLKVKVTQRNLFHS